MSRQSKDRCSFCTKFGPKHNKWSEVGYPDIHDTVLASRNGFICVPTLGQFVEGYILVVPTQHVPCIGALSEAEIYAFEDFLNAMRSHIYSLYGPSVVFEHGPKDHNTNAGTSISHAHVHILPVPDYVDVLPELQNRFKAVDCADWIDLHAIHKRLGSYLLFEDTSCQRAVFPIESVPSQFLRQVVANAIDPELEWDWRKNPGISNISATLERWHTFAHPGGSHDWRI